jgi:TonB family protein
MLKLTLLSLSLAACATAATGLDRDHSQRAKVKLDLAAVGGVEATFPEALDPTVPSVDRISHAVRAHLGDTATAELSLCVSPSGAVKQVELTRSSSYAPFDKALLADAATWQFASLPGPDRVMSCRNATIAYRVH